MNKGRLTENDLNMLFKLEVGSNLYGMNTPTSDLDLGGVFIPDLEYFFGYKNQERVELGYESKNEFGKNTSEAVDYNVISLKTFTSLALNNNPNVLEWFYAPKEKVTVFNKELTNILFDNANLFISKKCEDSFMGFATEQMHKMRNKPQNFKEMKDVLEVLEGYVNNRTESKTMVGESSFLTKHSNLFKDKNDHVAAAGMNFQKHTQLRKVKSMVQERLKSSSHRKDMWEKYGYDVKFAYNVFRLFFEFEMLCKMGKLVFPFVGEQKDFLMAVKTGQFSLEFVEEEMQKEKDRVRKLDKSKLPTSPNSKEVERLVVLMHKKFFGMGKICIK